MKKVLAEDEKLKYYFFNGEINDENMGKFLDFANNTDEKFTLFLTSNGGSNYCENVMARIIDEKCKKLIAVGQIQSAAFRLFMNAKCEKELEQNCFGMYHLATWQRRLAENGEFSIIEAEKVNIFKKQYNYTLKWLVDIKLSKVEIEKIKKNEDVFFSYDRMKELAKSKKV